MGVSPTVQLLRFRARGDVTKNGALPRHPQPQPAPFPTETPTEEASSTNYIDEVNVMEQREIDAI